jgi:hypothetical protein
VSGNFLFAIHLPFFQETLSLLLQMCGTRFPLRLRGHRYWNLGRCWDRKALIRRHFRDSLSVAFSDGGGGLWWRHKADGWQGVRPGGQWIQHDSAV